MLRKYLRRPFLNLLVSMRKWQPPGFEGAGFYDVLKFLILSLSESKFNLMAAAMAYNFFFAVFPTLILMFILIPYIPIPHLKKDVLNLIATYVPKEEMRIVTSIVNEFFQKQGSGIILLNIFLALRSATRGIIAMMGAFAQHEVGKAKRRKIWNLYGTALVIFSVLVALVLLSIIFMNVGIFLVKWLMSYRFFGNGIQPILLNLLNFAITYLLLLFSISLTYKIGSRRSKIWKFFSPGSILGGFLLLLTLFGLNYYFSNFGNYNKIYGSLGTIIILLIWFFYISIVLLIGFELNVAIDKAKIRKELFRKRDLEL